MDENLKFALTLIGGAVGGALVAGMFAFIGAWIADKREHKQWLRNERLRAYETYFAETRPWSVERWLLNDIDASKEAQAAYLQLKLIAPPKVVDASFKLNQQIAEYRTFRDRNKQRPVQKRLGQDITDLVFTHHITVLEQRAGELGQAMRKSLGLSRKEANYWNKYLQDDAPTDDEFIARAKGVKPRILRFDE